MRISLFTRGPFPDGMVDLPLTIHLCHVQIVNEIGGNCLDHGNVLPHFDEVNFPFDTGILGQLIGLYSAFSAIERAMDISPAIMMGGLKVSMITTLYGILIYLTAILIWFVLDLLASRKA